MKQTPGPEEVLAYTSACRSLVLPPSVNLYDKRGLEKKVLMTELKKKKNPQKFQDLLKKRYVGVFCSPIISMGCL